MAVWPTGQGKSLLFQLPPLVREQTSITISPLLALMANQVEELQALGVPVGRLGSDIGVAEERRCLESLESGELRVLYLGPERMLDAS